MLRQESNLMQSEAPQNPTPYPQTISPSVSHSKGVLVSGNQGIERKNYFMVLTQNVPPGHLDTQANKYVPNIMLFL